MSNSAPTPKPPDDNALAFALATIARPHLSKADADRIYIAIGIGDTFAAIGALITVIAWHRIVLGPDLAPTVATWLDGYRGQDTEPRLRHLLADITREPPPQRSTFEHRFGAALIAARDRRSDP